MLNRRNPFLELKPREQCASSSRLLLDYRSARSLGMSAVSKILKLATSRWKTKAERLRLPGRKAREEPPCAAAKPRNRRRIVVLGAPRVGKTTIVRSFLRDAPFEERYEPTAEDFHSKVFRIRGRTYQVDVLDAPGERGFPARRRLSILTGDVFLLVFSVDDRSSFEEARALREEILAAKAKLQNPGGGARAPTVVCANKMDLEPRDRTVSWAEACSAFAGDCVLFETSAKTHANLEEMFEALAARSGLPSETRPSRHRSVSMRSYQALRRGGRVPPAEGPYGALRPLARRPSLGSDLRQVLDVRVHGWVTREDK
ncbi:dexamethasone-induced Ras-related protein 1-like [Arapaima gigas]